MSADNGFAYDPHLTAPEDRALLALYDAEFGLTVNADDHHVGRTDAHHRGDVDAGDLFIDWSEFWDRDRTEADWLYEDVLARGRGHAFYAGHKVGKSLFLLWLAAFLAVHRDDVVVVYCDYEMTEDDVHERLDDMGYGPGHDLSRLRYWLLPQLAPLDTPKGGTDLLAVVDRVQAEHPDHHVLVVIDTTGRAVAGAENDADTYQNFYTNTGIGLKRRGVTWARLDHAGKDPAKDQRGSSAKGDDVDIVWKLEPAEGGITIRHKGVTRIRWAPEKVAFNIKSEPLRYEKVPVAWPAGTREVAALLDTLGVPVTDSANQAQAALREAGEPRRRDVVLAAVKYRKQSGTTSGTTQHINTGTTTGTTTDNPNEPKAEPPPEPPGTTPPARRELWSPPYRGTSSQAQQRRGRMTPEPTPPNGGATP